MTKQVLCKTIIRMMREADDGHPDQSSRYNFLWDSLAEIIKQECPNVDVDGMWLGKIT